MRTSAKPWPRPVEPADRGPGRQVKACTEVGYFARKVRTVEAPIDRDAGACGAAACGEPWQYYDL